MESINKEKDTKKKRLIAIIIAAFLICAGVTGFFIFQSRYTALSIRLQRLVGVVNLYDKNGSERSLVEKMRLNSGNKLTTETESLVTVALDNTKLLTMEEASKAQVNKRGKKLKFDLLEGNLFFNVTEKLGKKESFEIKTSTMAVGIRGTSAYVGMDFSGHEMVMVTDGTVHVVAENPRTGDKIETDVPAGMKIVIFLDDEAEGDATISFIMEPFKEEDLPAMALDTIHKNKKLRERVLKATGFREDKLERLYELNTTEGESMVGEAKEELSELGLDDAIPFMGDKVRYMVEAANDAVVIAEEDLDLEVAIIKGLEDTSDVAVEGGLEKEEVVSVIHTTSGVIGNLIVQAKENDLDDEAIIMVADNVSGAVTVAVKDMIVGDLSVDEIEGVVDTIGTVFGIAIDNGANEGPKAIIENVEDAYKFVKDTVNDEMNKNSNGEETSEALLRRNSGEKEAVKEAVKDNTDNTSDGKAGSTGVSVTNTTDNTPAAVSVASIDADEQSNNESDNTFGNTEGSNDTASATESETTSSLTSTSGNTNESPISQAVNTVKKFIIKWFASDENYAKNETISSQETEENVSPTAPSNPVKAASEYFTYVFRKWKAFFKGNDGSYTEAGEYASGEIPSATKDTNYVAQYDRFNRTYSVNLITHGGTVNSGNVTEYTYGTAVTLPTNVTKPSDSQGAYTFVGWFTQETGGTRVLSIPSDSTGDQTFHARFTQAQEFAVNVTASAGGNVTPSAISSAAGETVTLTVAPQTGYALDSMTATASDGRSVSISKVSDTEYTLRMPESDVDVNAIFFVKDENAVYYAVSVSNQYGSDVSLERTQYKAGETVSFSVTIDNGFDLYDVIYRRAGASLSQEFSATPGATSGVYSFTMPAYDTEVCAYADELFDITLNYLTTGGSVAAYVNGVAATTAIESDTVSISLTPNAGYIYDANASDSIKVEYEGYTGTEQVTLNAPTVSGNTYTYEFAMPYFPITVSVAFVSNTGTDHNVIIDSTNIAYGTITSDKNSAKEGEIVTLSASPLYGYDLSSVTVTSTSGTDISVSDSLSFTMPDENVTVSAIFAPLYSVTCVSANGGNVQVMNDESLAGKENLFRIFLQPGFDIESWSVVDDNGNSISATLTDEGDMQSFGQQSMTTHYCEYSFIMPSDNVTISAVFSSAPFNIGVSYSNDGNTFSSSTTYGTVTLTVGGTASSTAQMGEKVTIQPHPANGYYCSNMTVLPSTGMGIPVSKNADGTYSFTMPSGDVTVRAVFREKISLSVETYFIDDNGNETRDAAGTYGSVSLSKSTGIDPSEKIYLLTTPASGYYFDSFTFEGLSFRDKVTSASMAVDISESLGTTQTLKVYVKAVSAQTYSISVDSYYTAYISSDKTTASAGDTVSLTITPATGKYCLALNYTYNNNYSGASILRDGKIKSAQTVTFTMPAEDIVIDGSFTDMYEIVLDYASSLGTVTAPKWVIEGETVTITATPKQGCLIRGQKATYSYKEQEYMGGMPLVNTITEDVSLTNGTGSFVVPNLSNDPYRITVAVPFASESSTVYSVNMIASSNGTIDSDVSTALSGTKVTLTANPDSGYGLKTVTVTDTDGNAIDITKSNGYYNEYSFYMPDKNVNVNSEFAVLRNISYTKSGVGPNDYGPMFSGTNSAVEGSTVVISWRNGWPISNVEYAQLDKVEITYNNNQGTSVTEEITKDADGNYSFVVPASDVSAVGTFVYYYKVSGTCDTSGGTVTVSPDMVRRSEYATFTVTPETGYKLSRIMYYYIEASDFYANIKTNSTRNDTIPARNADGTYTYQWQIKKAKNNNIYFSFAKEAYNVNIPNSITGGTVSSDATAEYGNTVTLTVTPDANYELKSLTVTKASGGIVTGITYSGNEFYFTMPAEAVDVSATFVMTSETNVITNANMTGSSAWFGNSYSKVKISDSMELDADLTIPSGKVLEIAPNVTFTIPDGVTLTVAGELLNYGTITNNGTIVNESSIYNYSPHTLNNLGTIINNGTLVNGDGEDNDGRLNNFDGAEIINNGTIINNEGSVVNNDGDIEGNDIIGSGEINDSSEPVQSGDEEGDDGDEDEEEDEETTVDDASLPNDENEEQYE